MAWTVIFSIVLVGASYSNGFTHNFGVVLPHDPYVFIGKDLKITCNLTTPLPETSEALYFTKGNIVIPRIYIQALSSRSIQLTLPIVSPDDAGLYVCKLNRSGGYSTTIGSQLVSIEYEPKTVESISCTVYNWESLTCSWDLGVNYVHLDQIDVQVVWTVSNSRIQRDCPHLTMNSCIWKSDDGTFNSNMMYYMAVIVTNKKTQISAQSQVFRIDTKKIVKPSSVSNLKTSHNSTCLSLQWSHNSQGYDKIYRIQYQPVQSEWGSKMKTIQLDGTVKQKTICDLVPNTVYTVKIACKPVWDGFWSEDEATVIKLDDDVPAAPPEIQPGGFVEKHCSFEGCRLINVYWRPIIKRLANGEIINYKLTARDTGSLLPVSEDDTGIKTSGQLMLNAGKDYFIDVQGQTKVGLSPHKARILILAKDKKPPYPTDFVVTATDIPIYHGKLFRLHVQWNRPKTSQHILGYTLFWCNGSRDDLTCLDPLVWAVFNENQREYTKVVNAYELKSLLFGIAMETQSSSGETVSSGILWNQCIYLQKEKPALPPKNVKIITEQSEIIVKWDKFTCSEARGFVTQYNVYYCQAEEGHNCSGMYNVIHVNGQETSVALKSVSPTASYRVWIQASSANGNGPGSDPLYTSASASGGNSALTSEEIAWIVVGCIAGVVLSLLLFFCLFKKCGIKEKEPFKPYDDLPNVPLPPIPMIRPSSTMSKSPSTDGEEIYSKIPDRPPTPSSPESISVYEPLISQSESQSESHKGKLFIKLPGSASSLFNRLHQARNSLDTQELQNHHPNINSFRSRPKRCSNGLSYSADMLSGEMLTVSPYSCVDIVQCPNSEKIHRKLLHDNNKQCHSEGSMVDDPSYATNNLSVLPKHMVAKPPSSLISGDSREHFNIRLPHDKRIDEINSDTLKSSASNEINMSQENRRHTQDSNEMPEEKIPSILRKREVDETDNAVLTPPAIFVQESWPNCSNNNDSKVLNGYPSHDNSRITETLPNPHGCYSAEQGGACYRKELNIKPGPRPVSEVINVPPHFYGSLSLLDTGDTTEL